MSCPIPTPTMRTLIFTIQYPVSMLLMEICPNLPPLHGHISHACLGTFTEYQKDTRNVPSQEVYTSQSQVLSALTLLVPKVGTDTKTRSIIADR